MNLHFFEDAEAEFSKAAFYYEDQQPGLGKRYRDEIASQSTGRILELTA